MHPIPSKLRKEMSEDDYYKTCARLNNECEGRITWEHSFIYAGKQIQEKFSIIPLCWRHHLGDLLNKELNHYISLKRVIELEGSLTPVIIRYPRKNWSQEYKYLSKKYGN